MYTLSQCIKMIMGVMFAITLGAQAQAEDMQIEQPIMKAAYLAVGKDFNCAIGMDAAVRCWGNNSLGQLGTGATNQFEAEPQLVKNLPHDVFNIALGWGHACAVSVSKGMMCWGDNQMGELGNGTKQPALEATPVKGLPKDVALITAGSTHTCAVSIHEGMFCWGMNGSGQLGTGSNEWTTEPAKVADLPTDIFDISAGDANTCAISSSKGTFCWGDNRFNQLGSNVSEATSKPTKTTAVKQLIKFIHNRYDLRQTCGFEENGETVCWGRPRYSISQDLNMATKYGKVNIGIGLDHACMIAPATDDVMCWGDNSKGQLGVPLTSKRNL